MLKVALTFHLYMMRYGVALLASSFANQSRAAFSEDITRSVAAVLTEKQSVAADRIQGLREYLMRKPGSVRYTPLRRALERGGPITVERQDVLLSDPKLSSSVGALTQDYFDDALSLARTLKLVRKDHNLLLARGRLSLSTGWHPDDPFRLREQDSLYLGLWLLDADCDWIWAFLSQLPDVADFEITPRNRVGLLLESWRLILRSRQFRFGSPQNARIRTRLIELVRITERNEREKLNLGQPWSWFLIPRLELMLDAGILRKRERHGLTGYSLTPTGQRMRAACGPDETGQVLTRNYFSCRDSMGRATAEIISWDVIERRLSAVASDLRTAVGYFPIFETASALCVSQCLRATNTEQPLWELSSVRAGLWEESRSPSPQVRLAIDRQGQIYAFKAEVGP